MNQDFLENLQYSFEQTLTDPITRREDELRQKMQTEYKDRPDIRKRYEEQSACSFVANDISTVMQKIASEAPPSAEALTVMTSFCKSFMADLVAEAFTIQEVAGDQGLLQARHITEAYRRLERRAGWADHR